MQVTEGKICTCLLLHDPGEFLVELHFWHMPSVDNIQDTDTDYMFVYLFIYFKSDTILLRIAV